MVELTQPDPAATVKLVNVTVVTAAPLATGVAP
jgi:hypothetical protein